MISSRSTLCFRVFLGWLNDFIITGPSVWPRKSIQILSRIPYSIWSKFEHFRIIFTNLNLIVNSLANGRLEMRFLWLSRLLAEFSHFRAAIRNSTFEFPAPHTWYVLYISCARWRSQSVRTKFERMRWDEDRRFWGLNSQHNLGFSRADFALSGKRMLHHSY